MLLFYFLPRYYAGMSGQHTETWESVQTYEDFDDALSHVTDIKKNLFQQHLVVIKGMGRIGTDQFVAFAEQFGSLEVPLVHSPLHAGEPRIEVLRRYEEDTEYIPDHDDAADVRQPSSFYWHADRSFLPQPSFLTLARATRAPRQGGATQFLNTELAFANLRVVSQQLLRTHRGRHSYAYYHEYLSGGAYSLPEIQQAQKAYPAVEHPLVWRHPMTNREVLYPSPLTLESVTGPHVEATTFTLQRTLEENPAYLYTHDWGDDDVVVWDNIGVLHRGTPSRGARELQRLTIAQPSEESHGSAFGYEL